MKRYRVKCDPGQEAYFDILAENSGGFQIRLTRLYDGYEKTAEEFMNTGLFDICVASGYIYEDPETARKAVSVA